MKYKIQITLVAGLVVGAFWTAGRKPTETKTRILPASTLSLSEAENASGTPASRIAVSHSDTESSQNDLPRQPTLPKGLEDLREFRVLSRKVLRSRIEKRAWETLLADPALIRRSFLFLSETLESESELWANQENRILAVNFLGAAADWKGNPERASVVESLRALVVLDNLASIDSKKIQRSYAGDKLEAYFLLKKNAPGEAQSLHAGARGSRLRKFLKFANGLYRSYNPNTAQN